MRRKIVAGNWKMNNDAPQSKALVVELLEKLPNNGVEVYIAPSFVNLALTTQKAQGSRLQMMAQNMHFAENGAYTGEVSAQMLTSLGVKTTILGHSERRQYFNETDEALAKKVDTALKHGIQVVFCIGEVLAERKAGDHFKVVKSQLEKALFHLSEADWKHIILAYEPVWAIGTGETATPEQAQEIHAFIRQTLKEKYNETLANSVAILYGGSCNAKNAREIFSQHDVDGGLIGGASLKADDFVSIINSF